MGAGRQQAWGLTEATVRKGGRGVLGCCCARWEGEQQFQPPDPPIGHVKKGKKELKQASVDET